MRRVGTADIGRSYQNQRGGERHAQKRHGGADWDIRADWQGKQADTCNLHSGNQQKNTYEQTKCYAAGNRTSGETP